MPTHPPLVRVLSRLLVAGYRFGGVPRDEARQFLDDAIDEAWRRRRWSGLFLVIVVVVCDLARVVTGRAALAVTAESARRRPAPPLNERSSPMDRLFADLRYSIRGLARTPGFTAISVLTLSLGIGASTAVYAVVDGAILRPFPYPDMPSIVLLTERNRENGQGMSVSWWNFVDWKAGQDSFRELGLYRTAVLNLGGTELPERLSGALVSASVFDTMGIAPVRGRVFNASDDAPSVGRLAVVSERLWQTRFAGREDFVGSDVLLNNEPYRVVGIMPAGMRFPSRVTDVWLPLGLFVNTFPPRGAHPGLTAVGRLKPGVTIDQARTAMDVIARRLETQYPDSNKNNTVTVTSYHGAIVENVRPAMTLLLVAVGLLVLIGCANLASLCLARAEARQRELTIRSALGAGRGRLVRQLLLEAAILSVAGGALGVLVALGAIRAFIAARPSTIPRIDLIGIDWRVLGFAGAVSLATVLLFAVMPALRASKPDLQNTLRDVRTGSGLRALRLRRALVGAQLAVAMVLLVGAGLVMKSLVRLNEIQTGFDSNQVITARLTLPDAKYPTAAAWTGFQLQLIEQLGGIAGVEAFGVNTALPMEGGGSESSMIKEGDPPPSSGHPPAMSLFQSVGGDYFKAMGIPLRRGRVFDGRDRTGGTLVVVVDDVLVAKLFPSEDPIGRRVSFENTGPSPADPRPIWREIVGVVGTIKHYGLRVDRPFFQLYVPITQLPVWQQTRRPAVAIVARTSAEPAAFATGVRQAVARVDPTVPIYSVVPMTEYVRAQTEPQRLTSGLLVGFAAIALTLAMIGVYGVLSYSVTLRTREIGVRMALGAGRAAVLRHIVSQGMIMAAVGLVIGVGLAYAASQLIATQLYEVSPTDAATYVVVSGLLAAVAFAASVIPARRASSVDPLVALRTDN